jgi:hypothetical protein
MALRKVHAARPTSTMAAASTASRWTLVSTALTSRLIVRIAGSE